VSAFLGLRLASATSGRPENELLAQAVDGVLPLFRDTSGGFYFSPSDLAAVPRRSTCAVKDCGRPLHVVGLCLCSSHYRRHVAGDIGSRIQVEKAQRGAARRERTGQRMRLAARHYEDDERGHLADPYRERRENAEALQLGTPQTWQAIADAALERAWADLTTGAFAARRSSLPLRPAPPTTIQSPLMASIPSPPVEHLADDLEATA
jgi:hypothetical protein